MLDVEAIAMCIHPYDMTCLIWYTFESVCRAQSPNMTYEYKKNECFTFQCDTHWWFKCNEVVGQDFGSFEYGYK